MKLVGLISRFDPWRSGLCTCPSKLTLNPYTGCDHGCVYCYASSYVRRFSECRPKEDVVRRLMREARVLRGELLSVANSSDPYPRAEAELMVMRGCLQVLSECKCRVQVVTKSTLVARDVDLLASFPSMVSLTVTTDDDQLAGLLEPGAPAPSARLRAVGTLIGKGVPVSVRVDPIVPFVNDAAEGLMERLAGLGVEHVTCSTFKVRPDSWRRFSQAMPDAAARLRPLYFELGESRAGYRLLPERFRFKVLRRVASLARRYKMKFGTCREGLGILNTATCDGSWLLKEKGLADARY